MLLLQQSILGKSNYEKWLVNKEISFEKYNIGRQWIKHIEGAMKTQLSADNLKILKWNYKM